MTGSLKGKVALVIGASTSGGFGETIARELSGQGAHVWVSGRRYEPLTALAEEIGGRACPCDIRDENALAAMGLAILQADGRLDVAVNATGVQHAAPIRRLKAADMRDVIDTHFLGSLLFIRHAAQAMVDGEGSGGSIVTISSLTATLPGEGLALYAGTKAGVDHAVRVAALEYGPAGIRVNSVSPGLARTPMTEELFALPGFERAFVRETPLARLTLSADVAAAVAWLAQPGGFVTGQNLQVNGGASLRRLPVGRDFAE